MKGSGAGFVEFKNSVDELSEWFSQHYAVVTLIQIPLFSIGTYAMFKKQGFNFVEHLVINCFIAGQKLILHILTFPIYYWLSATSYSRPVDQFIDSIGYVLAFGTIFQLFHGVKGARRFWKTLLSLVIPIALFAVLFFTTVSIIIHYF